MMFDAGLSKTMRQTLWPEAVLTAENIGNITASSKEDKCPDELFFGKVPTLYPRLKEFGRIAPVTIRKKIMKKFEMRTVMCILLGYADNCAH